MDTRSEEGMVRFEKEASQYYKMRQEGISKRDLLVGEYFKMTLTWVGLLRFAVGNRRYRHPHV